MKHALVIGGSGMLSQTSLWLAEHGYTVSVIGRDIAKLHRLANTNPHIIPIPVDYSNDIECRNAIKQSISVNGAYDLVVAWIHGDGIPVIQLLDSKIQEVRNEKWKLFHVLGSGADVDAYVQTIGKLEHCEYHQIQLGFVIEQDGSRWLTHHEITSGVIEGMIGESSYHLVGTLTPWSQKP